jgi:hypothetical protein
LTEPNESVRRQILKVSLLVIAVSVMIGGGIAVVSLTVLNASGVLPQATPTTPGASKAVIPPPTAPTRTHHKPTGTPTKPARSPNAGQRPAIRLTAEPVQAGVFERVTLAGRYPNAGAVTLQVQRREFGSWVDFPTSATVSAGQFRTYVQLGRPGRNALRVVDPARDRASNAVAVFVG